MDLIEAELSEKIIGCAIQVHRVLGPGFLEKVYEEALLIELRKAAVQVEQQKQLIVFYDQIAIGDHRLDVVVDGRVVLELKACKAIDDVHLAIVRSYLKASRLQVGLILNFAKPTLEIRRVVLSA